MEKEITFQTEFMGLKHDIFGRIWEPEENPVGLVQIIHGMMEHSGRYEELGNYLSSLGFVAFSYDQAGHGNSVHKDLGEQFGFMDEKKGWDRLVGDAIQIRDHMVDLYPNLPIYVFGHSMGSFVARTLASRYGMKYNGYIFCGTSGPNPAVPYGKALAQLLSMGNKQKRKPSPLLEKAAFGSYNKKFSEGRAFSWLNSIDEKVKNYEEDSLSGHSFTTAGYRDLFTGMAEIQSDNWYKTVPKKPILLISGEDDPVGNYGKGIEQLYVKLRDSGHSQVTMHLYPQARHEILGDVCKEQVFEDLKEWLDKRIKCHAKGKTK